MSSFEEEFPSLKDLVIIKEDEAVFDWNRYVISVGEVHKHTIDKQRVRETIKRVCLQTGAEITEKHLLIDLGLDDE